MQYVLTFSKGECKKRIISLLWECLTWNLYINVNRNNGHFKIIRICKKCTDQSWEKLGRTSLSGIKGGIPHLGSDTVPWFQPLLSKSKRIGTKRRDQLLSSQSISPPSHIPVIILMTLEYPCRKPRSMRQSSYFIPFLRKKYSSSSQLS